METTRERSVEELFAYPATATPAAEGTYAPGAIVPMPAVEAEELLVADLRSDKSPGQVVEDKLLYLLRSLMLPVSQLRRSKLYKGRKCS